MVCVEEWDRSFNIAIKSCDSCEGLCINCALCESKIGLRLLDFKIFIPTITGRDNFFQTTAEPVKIVDKLLNLILTLNCPTVSIVEFVLALFAEFKFDGFNLLKSPPNFL